MTTPNAGQHGSPAAILSPFFGMPANTAFETLVQDRAYEKVAALHARAALHLRLYGLSADGAESGFFDPLEALEFRFKAA